MNEEELLALRDEAEARQDYELMEAIDAKLGTTLDAIWEPVKTIASSMVTEPLSGLIGGAVTAYDALTGGENPMQRGAETIEDVQGYAQEVFGPHTLAGKKSLETIAQSKPVQAISEGMEYVSRGAGDTAQDIALGLGADEDTAAAIGSVAYGAPSAALEGLGLKGGAGATGSALRRLIREPELTPETVKRQRIVEAGKEQNVPVLTSDVIEPKTGTGKLAANIADSLGFLGSGAKRAKQQAAREEALTGFVDNLDLELDTPAAENIVKSLNANNKKVLREASEQRASAVEKLTPFGVVPVDKSLAAIDEILMQQEKLGKTANQDITRVIQNYRDELVRGLDFGLMRDQRTQLIKAMKAAERSEDVSPVAAYSKVKQAMDKDMLEFARKNDRAAAKDWLHSNRKFADELEATKRTELKRILESGEATPEKVMPLLRGGKFSELNRLYGRLTPNGRVAAQKAIIQDALKEAKFFEVDTNPNPTLFSNAMNRPNRQAAVKTFFKGDDKKAIDSLVRILSNTKRAQEASVMPKTGYSAGIAAGAVTGGSIAGSQAAIALPLALSTMAAIKLYESAPFRNMLIRYANMQGKGKAAAKLGAEISAAISAQAARMERQEEIKNRSSKASPTNAYELASLQARVAAGDDSALDQMAIIEEAQAEKERQAMMDYKANVDNQLDQRGASILNAFSANGDARKTATDINTLTMMPMPIARMALDDLYSDAPEGYGDMAQQFASLVGEGMEVTAMKNVLQNYSLLPPDSKPDSIRKLIGMGESPDKAVELVNTIKPMDSKKAKTVADAIRTKVQDGQFHIYNDLIKSIEALA